MVVNAAMHRCASEVCWGRRHLPGALVGLAKALLAPNPRQDHKRQRYNTTTGAQRDGNGPVSAMQPPSSGAWGRGRHQALGVALGTAHGHDTRAVATRLGDVTLLVRHIQDPVPAPRRHPKHSGAGRGAHLSGGRGAQTTKQRRTTQCTLHRISEETNTRNMND